MSTPTPKPGQHLPGPPRTVDPQEIHTAVDALLDGLSAFDLQDGPQSIPRHAQVLERAHEVLVDALATVDKI